MQDLLAQYERSFELRVSPSAYIAKTGASGTTQLQKAAGMDRYTIRYKGELP